MILFDLGHDEQMIFREGGVVDEKQNWKTVEVSCRESFALIDFVEVKLVDIEIWRDRLKFFGLPTLRGTVFIEL